MKFIYIVNGNVGFYSNTYTKAMDFYKSLTEKYKCNPVIIPVDETNPDNKQELTGKITPEQALHIMTQTLYNPNDKKPVTYELTAVGPDECNFGMQGNIPSPYVLSDVITIDVDEETDTIK